LRAPPGPVRPGPQPATDRGARQHPIESKSAEVIRSRSNPLVVRLRRLAHEGSAYRRHGQVWVEGEHLCAAVLGRGWPVIRLVLAEAAQHDPETIALASRVPQCSVLADALYRELSTLESPSRLGLVIEGPKAQAIDPQAQSVVLDRVQDAGNVGSILRSAAALGVTQVLSIAGTAALWSPKVLRAGMGAHFALRLHEGLEEADVVSAKLALVATDAHAGDMLPAASLPQPCAWVFGHEGQGISPTLAARCEARVRIPQPGGEESLNVAAAAAICLYEAARRRA